MRYQPSQYSPRSDTLGFAVTLIRIGHFGPPDLFAGPTDTDADANARQAEVVRLQSLSPADGERVSVREAGDKSYMPPILSLDKKEPRSSASIM